MKWKWSFGGPGGAAEPAEARFAGPTPEADASRLRSREPERASLGPEQDEPADHAEEARRDRAHRRHVQLEILMIVQRAAEQHEGNPDEQAEGCPNQSHSPVGQFLPGHGHDRLSTSE